MAEAAVVLAPEGRWPASQIGCLGDGRLHLQDGPIDLIIGADGTPGAIQAAYGAATRRFDGLLARLCAELPRLRAPAARDTAPFRDPIAQRMHAAVVPFAAESFISPMAAVAGAVAEAVLAAMIEAASLSRAYVNNGGDIALHLSGRERFSVGLMDRPNEHGVMRAMSIDADDAVRGVATSGRHGRSFSLGIADAVTVLAVNASTADAAATLIANAVDLPGHPAILRVPADELQPDSDLRNRLVTRDVGELTPEEIAEALTRGVAYAQTLVANGTIIAAALHLCGETRVVGDVLIDQPRRLNAGRQGEKIPRLR